MGNSNCCTKNISNELFVSLDENNDLPFQRKQTCKALTNPKKNQETWEKALKIENNNLINNEDNPVPVQKKPTSTIFQSVDVVCNSPLHSEKDDNLDTKLLSKEDHDFLLNCLRNNFLFENLNSETLENIIENLIQFPIPKNNFLFKEGEEGSYFYILKSGELELIINNKVKKVLKIGECFGELALIHDTTRSASVLSRKEAVIYALSGTIFRDLMRKFNSLELKDRIYFLEQISIFSCLDNEKKTYIANFMYKENFKEGDFIVRKGENCQSGLYIIREGIVSVRNKYHEELRKLFTRDYFGQISVFLNKPRSNDVIAVGNTVCYNISLAGLKEALGENYQSTILFSLFKNLFLQNTILHSIFIESQIDTIFSSFRLNYYEKRKEVISLDATNYKKVVIVIEGELLNAKTEAVAAKRCSIYGEEFLLNSEKNQSKIIAYPDCLVLEADWDEIFKNLKIQDFSSLKIFKRHNYLKKIPIFSHLSESNLMKICKKMGKVIFEKGDVIVEENTLGDKFYLINKGKVKVQKEGKFIRELDSGNCFGEVSLLFDEKRTASIIAVKKTACFVLSKVDFIMSLDDHMISHLKDKIGLQDTSINLQDLYFVSYVGEGKFGMVDLVHNNKNYYAIKAVSRKVADRRKVIRNYILNEKQVLLSLDHPFIVKMVKTLKNKYFCFYLMEHINGINLYKHLKSNKRNLMDIKETQFYAATLLMIVDYLNKKKIAHRDFKPDNIMIDGKGYLKLIDFGTAKKITDFTYTVVGTPHYISPEIILGRGYTNICDFWSVGVCIFEIFYGVYPFGNQAFDIMEVYKDILYGNCYDPIKFNTDFTEFIRKLLTKKPNFRETNIAALLDTGFFRGFNAQDLIDFTIIPSFIPEVNTQFKNNFDTSKEKYEIVINKSKDTFNSFAGIAPGSDKEPDPNWTDDF